MAITVTCNACEQECSVVEVDLGIGAYEYWGIPGRDVRMTPLSRCCEADFTVTGARYGIRAPRPGKPFWWVYETADDGEGWGSAFDFKTEAEALDFIAENKGEAVYMKPLDDIGEPPF